MLKLLFCVCFVTFFSVINCNGHIAHVNVTLLQKADVNKQKYCIVEKPSYNLTMGTTVQINIKNDISSSIPNKPFYILRIIGNSTYSGFEKKTDINIPATYTINDIYMDYELDFYFSEKKQCGTSIHYEVSAEADPGIDRGNDIIIFAVIGGIGIIIIIAETALIFYCRSRFKALTRHNNLTRLKEGDESDGDRYSTNPKKKDKNVTPIIPEDNRQSEIYEEPNITIGVEKHCSKCNYLANVSNEERDVVTFRSLPSKDLRAPPPVPPGIPTSRSNHSNTSTLKMPPSPQTNGTSYPTFPRSKHTIQESLTKVSVGDRPQFPLPDEFYSKAEEEENLYEQPPQPQQSQKSLPPGPKFLPPLQQLPLPQKPIPLQKQLPPPQKQEPSPQKQYPKPQIPFPPPQNPPTSSLKKPNPQTKAIQEQLAAKLQEKHVKPPISQAKPTPPRNKTMPSAARMPFPPAPKPQPTVKLAINPPVTKPTPPMSPTLEQRAVPRAARMPFPPAPKPQSTVKIVIKPPAAKPKTPPISPTLEQQVQFFNQHRDDLPHHSSDDDDEWTYEPLYNI